MAKFRGNGAWESAMRLGRMFAKPVLTRTVTDAGTEVEVLDMTEKEERQWEAALTAAREAGATTGTPRLDRFRLRMRLIDLGIRRRHKPAAKGR
jgi:hypothetical protein